MNQQEQQRLQELNIDLWDANRNLLSYLIEVYRRNGITHEEFSKAQMLLRQASKALQRIHQPKGNTYKTNRRGYSTHLYLIFNLEKTVGNQTV